MQKKLKMILPGGWLNPEKGNDMKCSDCLYWWKDENAKYERCHWDEDPYSDLLMSPCEEDEYYDEYERGDTYEI